MNESRFMLQRWRTDGGYWETLHDLPTLLDAELYLDSWNTPHEYRILEYTEIRRTRKEGTT